MAIKFPLDLFTPAKNPYNDENMKLAHFYLLDSKTIGISKIPIEEWAEKSLMYGAMPYRLGKYNMTFELPPNVMEFYQLANSMGQYDISVLKPIKDGAILLSRNRKI